MAFSLELAEIFRRDLTRLAQQMEAFPEDGLLWEVVPGVTNSAGNLALHLEGNLREFIGRILGGQEYVRVREREFADSGVSRAELQARALRLAEEIPAAIAGLSAEKLAEAYPVVVLGKPLSVQQFLIHLSGHFNYHLGQIDYLRRVLTGGASVNYAGLTPAN